MSNSITVSMKFKITDYTQQMLDSLDGYESYAETEIAELFQDFVEAHLKRDRKTVDRFIQEICLDTHATMQEIVDAGEI
jgi:hypothetical protein